MGNEGSHQMKYGEQLQNDMKVSWQKHEPKNGPAGREGHCACNIGQKVFVFGGVAQNADGSCVESNELFAYDAVEEAWEKIEAGGDIPSSRSSAAMAAVGENIYLFGGLSQNSGWIEDVHVFSKAKNSWQKLAPEGKGPSARDKLACAVIGNDIYIFGGFGPQCEEPEEEEVEEFDEEEEVEEEIQEQDGAQFTWFNDLFIFDTKTHSWSSPMQMNLGVPTPRAAHAMCAVDKHLVIFGGRDSEARRNDLHIFDTTTRKWINDLDKLISGRQPEPRSFHTMCAVGSRLVVFGGRGINNQHFNEVHIFDTTTREWLQPAVEGCEPAARGVHSATVAEEQFVLFGGSTNFSPETMQCHTYFSDVYCIKTADVLRGAALPKDQENQMPVSPNVPGGSKADLPTAASTAATLQ